MPRPMKCAIFGLALLSMSAVGCAHKVHRSYAVSESAIDLGTGTSGPITHATAKKIWVNSHPLLYKPGMVFHNTGHGPITKTSAAVFLGVPAGVIGEVKQIVAGIPRPVY